MNVYLHKFILITCSTTQYWSESMTLNEKCENNEKNFLTLSPYTSVCLLSVYESVVSEYTKKKRIFIYSTEKLLINNCGTSVKWKPSSIIFFLLMNQFKKCGSNFSLHLVSYYVTLSRSLNKLSANWRRSVLKLTLIKQIYVSKIGGIPKYEMICTCVW